MNKKCCTCKCSKESNCFHRNKSTKDGLHPMCKECRREYRKRYPPAEYSKKYHKDYNKTYRLSKRGKERYNAYRKSEKGILAIRMGSHRRRIREVCPEGVRKLTGEDWALILKYYENECAYCCKKTHRLEIEHVIPLSKGGFDSFDNITVSCKSCNSSKRDRILWSEWVPKKPSVKFLFWSVFGIEKTPLTHKD